MHTCTQVAVVVKTFDKYCRTYMVVFLFDLKLVIRMIRLRTTFNKNLECPLDFPNI